MLANSAWNWLTFDKYMKKTHKFLKALIILMLLIEELSMRKMKLTVLKHSNDWYISHNFVIESEHMIMISEYNKIKLIAKWFIIIIWYFLNQLNMLMLVYFIDIRLFLKLAEIEFDLHVDYSHFSLIWESDDIV